MKEIKVYLQYPWRFPDSPYYKYLLENPPEEIMYLNAIGPKKGVITNKKFFLFSNFLKESIRNFFNFFNKSIPNAHLTKIKDCFDLIHCAHCLSRNKDRLWVVDIEGEWQFYVGEKRKKTKEKVRNILNKNVCKKIIPWTEYTAKEIIKDFPELERKIEVVYPAVPLNKKKKKEAENIVLLFVGRYFYSKGGLHSLEVMDRLTKKYSNVKGILVSNVPKKIKEKYKNKNIKIYNLMPHKEVLKLYENSDIFIYPGYSDTFGFALLEAMSFGIPIVTVDGIARKEIISEGKTGFIVNKSKNISLNKIDEEIISNLFNVSEKVILNKKLRKKMSQDCIEEIKKGKFSIKERNKKLKKIYEDAIK